MAGKDNIVSDLEVMASAVNYRKWILGVLGSSLGRRVVELGAGIGNFTEHLLDRELVVALDSHAAAVERLKSRFSDNENVVPVLMDIADPALRKLSEYRPDTVLCINVLEHVEDDRAALSNMAALLPPSGHLALFVPAFRVLMGSIDRLVGHHRRYGKAEIQDKLKDAGFEVVSIRYMNCLAVPAWFWNNRVVKRSEESGSQVVFYDRFVVPWLSRIESVVHPPFGLSLAVIARKS